MKTYFLIPLIFAAASAMIAAPFTPKRPDRNLGDGYGVGCIAWCFGSELSREATGTIEICYAEAGNPERVLGRVDVRPFRSSDTSMPDLRILFTKAEVDRKTMIVLLVGYGLRAGAFVADVPALASHSLVSAGAPAAAPSGEFTLLGFGDGPVGIKRDGTMEGARGRLFFRYVERP